MSETTLAAGRLGSSGSSLRRAPGHLSGWLAFAWTRAVRRWVTRRDERILLAKSDQELKDIGISRADIPRVVRTGRA